MDVLRGSARARRASAVGGQQQAPVGRSHHTHDVRELSVLVASCVWRRQRTAADDAGERLMRGRACPARPRNAHAMAVTRPSAGAQKRITRRRRLRSEFSDAKVGSGCDRAVCPPQGVCGYRRDCPECSVASCEALRCGDVLHGPRAVIRGCTCQHGRGRCAETDRAARCITDLGYGAAGLGEGTDALGFELADHVAAAGQQHRRHAARDHQQHHDHDHRLQCDAARVRCGASKRCPQLP